MLSEYITSLADVSFHIVAYMYARFRYSGKNLMRFAVFWRISVRFCGFRTSLTPPSLQNTYNHTYTHTHKHTHTYIHLAGFFKTLSPNGPFASNSFFRPEISLQSSHPEKTTRVQPLLFSLLRLSFSSLFVFLLSFSFVTVILELFGLKKPYF